MRSLRLWFGFLLAVGAGVAASCGGDDATSTQSAGPGGPGGSGGSGGSGGAGGGATTSSSTTSSGGGGAGGAAGACEQACTKLTTECGFPDCPPQLDCSTPEGDCFGQCLLDASCAAIASLATQNPDPALVACLGGCQGGQGGGGGGTAQACGECAFQNCQTEIFACGAPCQDFATCASNCTDQACADDCLAQYPQAQPVVDCACNACPSDCALLCGGGGTGGGGTGGGGQGGAGGGMAVCASCADAINGSTDPICAAAQPFFDDLATCTCVAQCPNQCAGLCGGGMANMVCQNCIGQNCGAELQGCLSN